MYLNIPNDRNISKRLKKLSSLRNAPEELLRFLNEILDIQVILTLVKETYAGFGNDYRDTKVINHVNELLGRAIKVLDEFDDIIQNKIGQHKSSWKAYIQNVSRLRE